MDRCQIVTRIKPPGGFRGRCYSIITDNPDMVWALWRKIGITDGAKQALQCRDLKKDGQQTKPTTVTYCGQKSNAYMTRWNMRDDVIVIHDKKEVISEQVP